MRGLGHGVLLAIVVMAGTASAQVADIRSTTQFRVCADPANAPVTTRDGTGFENKLADYFGQLLDLPVSYAWFPSGMGFITKTLRAGTCDVVMGYAQGDEMVQNTNHYYTSVYGLVTRRDGDLPLFPAGASRCAGCHTRQLDGAAGHRDGECLYAVDDWPATCRAER